MSLEAMVDGALRDMTSSDSPYVFGSIKVSSPFDCGFVPRFVLLINSSFLGISSELKEGENTVVTVSDSFGKITVVLRGTILSTGYSKKISVIAFK